MGGHDMKHACQSLEISSQRTLCPCLNSKWSSSMCVVAQFRDEYSISDVQKTVNLVYTWNGKEDN